MSDCQVGLASYICRLGHDNKWQHLMVASFIGSICYVHVRGGEVLSDEL